MSNLRELQRGAPSTPLSLASTGQSLRNTGAYGRAPGGAASAQKPVSKGTGGSASASFVPHPTTTLDEKIQRGTNAAQSPAQDSGSPGPQPQSTQKADRGQKDQHRHKREKKDGVAPTSGHVQQHQPKISHSGLPKVEKAEVAARYAESERLRSKASRPSYKAVRDALDSRAYNYFSRAELSPEAEWNVHARIAEVMERPTHSVDYLAATTQFAESKDVSALQSFWASVAAAEVNDLSVRVSQTGEILWTLPLA